jgi:hypothetical protein
MIVPERGLLAQPDSDIAGVPVDITEAAAELADVEPGAPAHSLERGGRES